MTTPETTRILTAIADTLRDRIAPVAAHDPWAASELRSIDVLLALVVARLEHGDAVLAADNDDLRALFAELADHGHHLPTSSSSESPEDENLAMRTALEALIPTIHGDERDDEAIGSIRRYLVRATERDQALYGPMTRRRAF